MNFFDSNESLDREDTNKFWKLSRFGCRLTGNCWNLLITCKVVDIIFLMRIFWGAWCLNSNNNSILMVIQITNNIVFNPFGVVVPLVRISHYQRPWCRSALPECSFWHSDKMTCRNFDVLQTATCAEEITKACDAVRYIALLPRWSITW